MRKNYDFSNAVRNPHAGKNKDGYTIIVEHKDYDEIITVTKAKKQKSKKDAATVIDSTASVINT